MPNPPDLFVVFAYGLLTAIATGFGALPLVWGRRSETTLANGQVIAAALMVFASLQLLNEARQHDWLMPVAGALTGVLLIRLTNVLLQRFPDLAQIIESDNARGAREGFLIIFVMTIHSAAEGVGIGVSFGGGRELGVLIATTIALHNVPEGLAIALVTVPRGMSVTKAALWSVFSSLPQPVIGVLAFSFVLVFQPFLPFGLGLAAGAMLWMVWSDLLPDARKQLPLSHIVVLFLTSGAAFYALLRLL